ncbi:hypothetical protein CAPTEDRAFT_173473 [Capitella teleta]|uniref:Tetraspanin n=1 Tax=Capitella teleta TaxID=283909 RepID=R7UE15_CAPTE|nr:hypothetical protein CAPTEDRAFT_173473 [Capitella teleta]|eukprot:ELU01487.1 hypothetical protein CAPTEDRAFT_173473 [Capitella teleta]
MNSPSSYGPVRVRGKDDGCCSVTFLRYVLFVFNFIFWLSGAAILGVGLWTYFAKHSYITLLTSGTYPATTFLLIGTGSLILLVGIIGCCGAWRENRGCLMTYASFLLLIFLLEAVIGILAYVYEDTIHDELGLGLKRTMQDNYMLDTTKTAAINNLHQEFKCCGAFSFQDWGDSRWLTGNPDVNNSTPDSCCKTVSFGCAISDHPSNIYYEGCVVELSLYFKEHLIVVGAVAFGFSCLQLFGIVFSCCLAKKISDFKQRSSSYYS